MNPVDVARFIAPLWLLSIAGPVGSASDDSLAWEGFAELGVRFAKQDEPFGDDGLTGFFDQYGALRYSDGVAWSFSPLELDLGLRRQDGTRLLDSGVWSVGPWSQRGQLHVDWRGLDFDLDGFRFRSEDLRLFPSGTDQDGALGLFPVFGSRYTPDVPSSNPLGRGSTFFVRRNHLDSGLAWRPEGFGVPPSVLRAVEVTGHWGARSGFNQDRFLLDDIREPTTRGNERFRGNRRRLDQRVIGGGGRAVLVPIPGWTAVFGGDFEAFRERAAPVTFGSLGASNPQLTPGTPAEAAREFFFVPDTNRSSGSLRIAGRFGRVAVAAGGSAVRLEQVGGLSSLQQLNGAPATALTRYAATLSVQAPLGGATDVGGFLRYRDRHNDMDLATFDRINPPDGHVDPFLRRRRSVEGEIEFRARPWAKLRLRTGYRARFVHRTLRFSSQFESLRPGTNLQGPDSLTHELYLGSRTQWLGRFSLKGEVGLEHAPRVSLPRDFESAVRIEAGASGTLGAPIPVALAASGRWQRGVNRQTLLRSEDPDGSRRKRFERSRWSFLVSAFATPAPGTQLSAAFVQERDGQRFRHIRSDLPRLFGPEAVRFYIDSNPEATSDIKTFTVGIDRLLTRSLSLRVGAALTWVDYGLEPNSNTALRIGAMTRFRDRILSLDTDLRYEPEPGVWFGLGYRLDDYHQGIVRAPLDFSGRTHLLTLSLGIDLALLATLR